MSYTLDDLAAACRAALRSEAGAGGLERVRLAVQRALRDPRFVATHFQSGEGKEREILYEDPELGFCICTHVYEGAKRGRPHDHGPTWAVYGQAMGETEMTDWRLVTPPEGGRPGRVELTRRYRLEPGDAHLYDVGDIHAPLRDGPTRLIRIEGRNTDTIERTPLEPASEP